MDKHKKILIIGGSIEGVILTFCLVVSIIVLATMHKASDYATTELWQQANLANGKFIGTLQNNPMLLFFVVLLPVLIMVALDLVYFAIVASQRESNLSDAQLAEIKKQAEEEVKAELEKEAKAEAPKAEEKPAPKKTAPKKKAEKVEDK